MIGTRIGQYTVLEKIGEGGMGAVWKARDEKLGRTVALKFLSKADSPDSRARFTLEARAASSLSHPGIVTIHDIFDHEDRSCIVMEFVEGSTLTHLIPAAGMPARDVVRLGIQIADALSAAHKSNVIHRDLKPGNIMVTPDGRAKLLDFGLAKMAEIAAAPDDHTRTIAEVRTTEGSILGTVNYMSPEQAQGKPVDTRSDIFSLGTVLYEMTTGHKAFDGDTTISTITTIMRDEPASLPHELGRVIGRCLRKEPDRRFQTALDVRNALEEVHEEIKSGVSAMSAAPPATASKPARRLMIAAAAGVVALGLGIWALMSFSGTPAAPVDSIVVRPFSGLPGLKSNPSFSPDGNTIVMVWDGGVLGRPSSIYAMLLDGGKPLRLTNTAMLRESYPFYSHDGRRVFFTRSSEGGSAAYSVPALGGDETKIANGAAYTISADGQWLLVDRNPFLGFSTAESGIFAVPITGGPEHRILPEATDFVQFDYSFSPDGKWVYFSRSVRPQPQCAFHSTAVNPSQCASRASKIRSVRLRVSSSLAATLECASSPWRKEVTFSAPGF